MIISFTLTMPNRSSWNGKWSGEDRYYAITRSFTKRQEDKARKILESGSYYYRWDDGWGASVFVKEVTSAEAAKIRKRSNGFCGYEWMVNSIINHGQIFSDHQIPKEAALV